MRMFSGMTHPLQVVIASRSLEGRRGIATVLIRLGLDPICVSSISQCRELLVREDVDVDVVFSDRFLADGDYSDLLSVCRASRVQPYLVLACPHTNTEYQQAIAEGVFEVIAVPYRPTDIEWMLIQVRRKRDKRDSDGFDGVTADLIPIRKPPAKNIA